MNRPSGMLPMKKRGQQIEANIHHITAATSGDEITLPKVEQKLRWKSVSEMTVPEAHEKQKEGKWAS